jgi:bifunctional non-homologous end joining protein LigD
VRLLTRKGLDWADRLPHVAGAFARVTSAMLDGELVALRSEGVSSFPDLQTVVSEGVDHKLHFYVFDLLQLNGLGFAAVCSGRPQADLSSLADWPGLRYSEYVEGSAGALVRARRCILSRC